MNSILCLRAQPLADQYFRMLNDIRDLVARYGSGIEYKASEASEGRSESCALNDSEKE